jgi:FAD synthetase
MRIILFGTFDHLHPGHNFVLDEAQKRNGEVYIVVARDSNVEKIKGRKPDQSEEERMKAIADAYPSFTVLLGAEHDMMARLREVKPDLILMGYDQKLPPGVSEKDLGVPVERLKAFEPEKYKSSLRRH